MGWGGGWKALSERPGGLWEGGAGGYLGGHTAALCGGQTIIKTHEQNCFHMLHFLGATQSLEISIHQLKYKSIKQ